MEPTPLGAEERSNQADARSTSSRRAGGAKPLTLGNKQEPSKWWKGDQHLCNLNRFSSTTPSRLSSDANASLTPRHWYDQLVSWVWRGPQKIPSNVHRKFGLTALNLCYNFWTSTIFWESLVDTLESTHPTEHHNNIWQFQILRNNFLQYCTGTPACEDLIA